MIVLVVIREFNEETFEMETIVSHGIDTDTLENVILPCDPLKNVGHYFDEEYGYVLRERIKKDHDF